MSEGRKAPFATPLRRYLERPWAPVSAFLTIRLFLVLALPYEVVRGYGDLPHFVELAKLGRPFLDFWVEFPPVFPFLSRATFLLAGGREHTYGYLLFLVMTLAQAVSIHVFQRLAEKMHGDATAEHLALTFSLLLAVLPYGWWYFDALAVLSLLVAMLWLAEGRRIWSGVAIAFGMLTKWFPAMLLAEPLRRRSARDLLIVAGVALGLVLVVFGALYLSSPDMTAASLASQASKGSWETAWALLDGNLATGNFGPEAERLDPGLAYLPRGNPTRVSPWLTLFVFAGLGLLALWRWRGSSTREMVALQALAWCLFGLWSPGWSPQWVIYLLPLALLSLNIRQGYAFSLTLVLISLLEWPILLSRGRFDFLWLPISLRVIVFILLAIAVMGEIRPGQKMDPMQTTGERS